MQSNFADALINIAVTGAVVRLDFGVAIPVRSADGKQEIRINPTQQVVMPMDGFIRAFGALENAVKKLVADGVIKVEQTSPPPAPSDVITTSGI